MSLTKRDRNKIYKEALRYYIEIQRNGLCYSLEYAAVKLDLIDKVNNPIYLELCGSCDTHDFPEIMKYKPNNFNSYWFPKSDTQSRINILEAAIKETNPKPKTIKQ